MSAVPAEFDYRTRTTPPPVTRRNPRLDLGAARIVPAMRKNVHDPARRLSSLWSLQSDLPAAGMGIAGGTQRQLGAIRCSLQRSHRLPDPSTLRRWALRRLTSLCVWAQSRAFAPALWKFLRAPTILAWDFIAAARILPSREGIDCELQRTG